MTKSLSVLDDRRPIIDRAIFSFANGSNEAIDVYAVEPGDGIDDQRPLLNDFGFGASETLEVLASILRPGCCQPGELRDLGGDFSELCLWRSIYCYSRQHRDSNPQGLSISYPCIT